MTLTTNFACHRKFHDIALLTFSLENVFVFPKATNDVISRAPETTIDEMESAVAAAKAAFPAWAEQSILSRQQVMFNLQHLVKKHMVGNNTDKVMWQHS